MRMRRVQQSANAQALVEYALILALVTVAVIVAASLIGLATQRIYGVVVAALGGSHKRLSEKGQG